MPRERARPLRVHDQVFHAVMGEHEIDPFTLIVESAFRPVENHGEEAVEIASATRSALEL